MGEGGTRGASDMIKAKSSGEDLRATGGLVSNLPHPRVNKTKQHMGASQPVNLSSVHLRWYVECLLAVVYLVYHRRKSYATRVDILPVCLLRTQDGRRSKDFRVL